MEPIKTRLSNPPIQEALIDFRFSATEDDILRRIEIYVEEAKGRFSKIQSKMQFSVNVNPGDEVPASMDGNKKVVGYMLTTDDGRSIIQCTSEGFTANILPVYSSWDELMSLAMDEWQQFSSIVGEINVNRVAMRYINNIEVAIQDGTPLASYIGLTPAIPSGLPLALDNYFLQVTLAYPDEIKANVTSTIRSAEQGTVSIILDIDVYKMDEYSNDIDAIISELTVMRSIKNEIFYRSLTDDALTRYK